MVEAVQQSRIDQRTASSLVRLALFDEQEGEESEEEEDDEPVQLRARTISSAIAAKGVKTHLQQPTSFHLLLAAFVVLLHRYTGDTDLIIATSSPSSPSPLLLRIKLDPADSFWSLVKRIQWVEQEAEDDKISYDELVDGLGRTTDDGEAVPAVPLFRVRFFDVTDETEHSFVQSTSLTSDLTVFVTSTTATPTGSTSGTATPTSRSGPTLPTISLTLSYNALVFSQPRIAYTLDQLLHLVNHASNHPLDAIGSISLLTVKQRKLLPDPKKDLEWTGFRGAITDIFSANAAKFPDRVCIVESTAPTTAGGANGKRQFTYQQIDEASNVLAHHLVQGGVQREEVVTVYSTRGVDLVVAVMGVLKAGATFSVIGASTPSPELVRRLTRGPQIPPTLLRVKTSTSKSRNLERWSSSPQPELSSPSFALT